MQPLLIRENKRILLCALLYVVFFKIISLIPGMIMLLVFPPANIIALAFGGPFAPVIQWALVFFYSALAFYLALRFAKPETVKKAAVLSFMAAVVLVLIELAARWNNFRVLQASSEDDAVTKLYLATVVALALAGITAKAASIFAVYKFRAKQSQDL